MTRLTLLALVWLASGAAAAGQRGGAPGLPADPEAFIRKVREAVRFDYELQKEFTYIERRRDIKMSRLGKISVGPQRTFEVYPAGPGRTYKRLIAIEGKPLDAEELARRDEERRTSLREEEERRRTESPRERRERLEKEAEELREREAIVDDGFAVFKATFTHREVVDGEPLLVATLTARPDVRVTTREGRFFKKFAGTAWISETDYQIARLDMRAVDDVSIGWGILGQVHKGSRFVFARRKFQGVWLPAEVTFDASGRTLLFRTFDIDTTTTYSGYRRQESASH